LVLKLVINKKKTPYRVYLGFKDVYGSAAVAQHDNFIILNIDIPLPGTTYAKSKNHKFTKNTKGFNFLKNKEI